MEIWKEVAGHPSYLISSFGRIKRKGKKKIHSGSINNKGYVRFDLSENGKRFVLAAHRAVAEAFIQREDGKDIVNHKDGNKRNNNVDNLEWCTCKENSIHAFSVLGIQPVNKKAVMCIETGVIYESTMDAERKTGIFASRISSCCTGKRNTTKGYHWKYC